MKLQRFVNVATGVLALAVCMLTDARASRRGNIMDGSPGKSGCMPSPPGRWFATVTAVVALVFAVPSRAQNFDLTLILPNNPLTAAGISEPYTLVGSSSFESGTFNGSSFTPDQTFGSQTFFVPFSNPTSPPPPMEFSFSQPVPFGDAIVWQFGGAMIGTTPTGGTFSLPTFAFLDSTFPSLPPTSVPELVLVNPFGPGTITFTKDGTFITYDAAVEVGTWEIRVAQVPEPATLALLGIGLAGLCFSRRDRKH